MEAEAIIGEIAEEDEVGSASKKKAEVKNFCHTFGLLILTT